jgi:hypothetical protein
LKLIASSQESTMPQRSPSSDPAPQGSGVEPRTTPQESGHQAPNHDDHPQGERSSHGSGADTTPDESGRNRNDNVVQSDSDEDSRTRKREPGS